MWSEKARHTLDAMEGDSEKPKISYFYHWIDGEGMGKVESWKNKKILISQEEYDRLAEDQKEGKYSSDSRSNSLLAVEELHFAKQGSMDSGEFHAHVVKIAQIFPNPAAEERAVRATIFLGMNSTQARDKSINFMNEEGKELTVKFLIQQLEIEDCNAQHKSLSQLDSTTLVNLLHMTMDRTETGATNQNELVERIRGRIILEHTDLLILVINLENPQGWKESP